MNDRFEVIVNGRPHMVTAGTTVAELLAALELDRGRVAVECNQEVVARADHACTELRAGDRLEVVTFVGGG